MRCRLLPLVLCGSILAALPSLAFAEGQGGCAVPEKHADVAGAIAACTRVLASPLADAARAEALKTRGRANHMAGKLDDAIADFEAAIKLAPKDAELRMRRGWTAYDKHDLRLVVVMAQQALALNADYAPAYDLLGTAASQTGDLVTAKGAYDKSVALQPDKVLPRYHRFELFKRVGAQREALAELDEMLRLNLAQLDTTFTDIQRKNVTYRTLVRLDRATTLEAMGRFKDAAEAYDEFVKVDPGAISYGYRGQFHFYRDDFANAESDLDKALTYDPNFWFLHYLKGRTYHYAGRYNEAVTSYNRAHELYPANGLTLWGRALAQRGLDNIDAAIADAKTAVTVDRGFLDRKARTLSKLGYLLLAGNGNDSAPAVNDAAQACMLDNRCF